MSISRTTRANDTKDIICWDVIKACDAAMADTKKQVEIRDLRLKTYEDQVAGLNKTVAEKDSELNSIFRNPYILFGAGFVLGVVLAK